MEMGCPVTVCTIVAALTRRVREGSSHLSMAGRVHHIIGDHKRERPVGRDRLQIATTLLRSGMAVYALATVTVAVIATGSATLVKGNCPTKRTSTFMNRLVSSSESKRASVITTGGFGVTMSAIVSP